MKTLLFSLFLIAMPVHAAEGQLKAGVFDPPRVAPDFSLRGSDGSELKLSRYRGKVVALGFGFTNCESVCPTTLATLARARRKLGADADELQVVYVTVDPARDSPQRMREYLAAFDASFIGATGTSAQLENVRREYGIATLRKPGRDAAHYALDHSSFVYLVDREGSLRALSPYGSSADDIAHDVAILLKK
jgi:protein SCO1/2